MQYLYNHTWTQNEQRDLNVCTSLADWHAGRPVKFMLDEAALESINKNKAFIGFLKWYADYVSKASEPSSVAALNNPSLVRFLTCLLADKTALKKELYQKCMFVDKAEEELSSVFDMQHWANSEGSGMALPCPYGCSEVRLTLSGQAIIAGTMYDAESPLVEQLNLFTTSNGPDLATKVSAAPSFLSVCGPGSIICIPAGYIVSSYALKHTTGIRWSVTVNKRVKERDIIRQVAVALLEAYPGLRATLYTQWLKYLQNGQS